jgi:hypothetical protein
MWQLCGLDKVALAFHIRYLSDWLITHTARVRFPVISSGFFKITTIFRRRCKAVGPGYYLVVVMDLTLPPW